MKKIDLYERKVFYSREDKGWIALAPDLPGCSAFGDTPAEALKELNVAMGLWLDVAKERSRRIPEALAGKDLAGKILLRLPKELHREYIGLAAEAGVSLNQYMLYVLARFRELGNLARHTR
jgi:predicted RNase H-like HicB family nuclease